MKLFKKKEEHPLDEYWKKEKELMDDILYKNIPYEEAYERFSKICDLIPYNYEVHSPNFSKLMKEKYGNHPDYNKYWRTFIIPVGELTREEAEAQIKELMREYHEDINYNSHIFSQFDIEGKSDVSEKYSIVINNISNFRVELIKMIEKVRYNLDDYNNLSSSQIAEIFENKVNEYYKNE